MQPPTFGKKASTRDLIIQIFGEEWPLTIKQLHERVTKKSEQNITYQAVHKVLKQLLTEGVVEFDGKHYNLNKNWIKQNSIVYGGLLKRYSSTSEKTGSFKHLEFDSLLEWGKFLIHHYYFEYPNDNKQPCICFWEHTICSFGLSEEDNEACRKIFAYADHYAICSSGTFLDTWAADYLTRLGKNCVCNVPHFASDYVFIQGNYLMFVFLSPEIKKELNKFYETVTELGSAEAEQYLRIITRKTTIFVIILEDEKLSSFWRQKAIILFKEYKTKGNTS